MTKILLNINVVQGSRQSSGASIRKPQADPDITPGAGPGVKSKALAQYNPWMIENAALGRPFECYVNEDASIPVTYFKDAIRAADMLYDAPEKQIKTICYNISGVSPAQTAKELELTIKKFIPEAELTPNRLLEEKVCPGKSCNLCVENCPGALSIRPDFDPKAVWHVTPARTDIVTCRRLRHVHYCFGRCIKICPVGSESANKPTK